jgi:hypothetical protein
VSEQSDKWADIERDYRASVPLGEIRERHSVTVREIFLRARTEGWKRGSLGGEISAVGERVLALVEEVAGEAIRETADEMLDSHKALTGRLRGLLSHELADYQAMTRECVSFLDGDRIAELRSLDDGGKALRAYQAQAMRAAVVRGGALEKLTRMLGRVVEIERRIWALDRPKSAAGGQTYDDILDELRKPLVPQSLPENVLEFDRKTLGRGRALR